MQSCRQRLQPADTPPLQGKKTLITPPTAGGGPVGGRSLVASHRGAFWKATPDRGMQGAARRFGTALPHLEGRFEPGRGLTLSPACGPGAERRSSWIESSCLASKPARGHRRQVMRTRRPDQRRDDVTHEYFFSLETGLLAKTW